ncbi:MAG: glycosyltransferase family 39 protein [Bryobacterales bacterium]|nr:glycosyltransferase family 39 protein [Bryobacterales bacterium]
MLHRSRPGSPQSPLLFSRWELPLLTALLLCFGASLIWLAHTTGITVDEPPHLLSAHLYWSGEDTLYPGDMPPAIKIAGGWVSHLFPLPVPRDDARLWASRIEWDIARVMMERLQSPLLQNVFFYSRLPLLLFPLLTCVLLWWWARQLFSPAAALLGAALFCCSPTVLGHGALFKNDLAASFGFLFFWYRAWVYWQSPSTRHALWLGAACLTAILAKMSMLILLPLGLLLLLTRHLAAPPRNLRALLLHLAAGASVLYVGSAAAWQFDITRATASEIRTWKARPNVPDWIALAAQPLRLLPTPPACAKAPSRWSSPTPTASASTSSAASTPRATRLTSSSPPPPSCRNPSSSSSPPRSSCSPSPSPAASGTAAISSGSSPRCSTSPSPRFPRSNWASASCSPPSPAVYSGAASLSIGCSATKPPPRLPPRSFSGASPPPPTNTPTTSPISTPPPVAPAPASATSPTATSTGARTSPLSPPISNAIPTSHPNSPTSATTTPTPASPKTASNPSLRPGDPTS